MDLKWEWQDRAACRGSWPPVDMLDVEQGGNQRALRMIKTYCHHCPVVLECAEFALSDLKASVGIWGGVHLPAQKRADAILALKRVYTTLINARAA